MKRIPVFFSGVVLWCACALPLSAQTPNPGASWSANRGQGTTQSQGQNRTQSQNQSPNQNRNQNQNQNADENQNADMNQNQNVMLASSSADYMVTPGDVYTLAYAAGTTPVSYIITVDTSYRIRVSNLGIINGAGKTFIRLKGEVEATVARNYPLSGVQLVLTRPAVFRVYVTGEVYTAGEVAAWGLSRLSSLAEENFTEYTSIRDITIKSADGRTTVYDLFRARRLGDITQDPYLRPGDVVRFGKAERLVTLDGAVERPGSYQLLAGEQLKDLVEQYGSGMTPLADRTRLELVRIVDSTEAAGDKIFLTPGDLEGNFELKHYDAVLVPSMARLRPVMFVEGAVNRPVETPDDFGQRTAGAAADLAGANRLVVQFEEGETYASLVRAHPEWFTAVSDTGRAYIERGGERLAIDLNPLLYDAGYRGAEPVLADDVLVIPFRQYFVTVAGAVVAPGRYPYIPDRTWEYYIALAGGFVKERNVAESVVITDIGGKRLGKSGRIEPETVITARTNHVLYYINIIAPLVTATLTAISTIISIQIMSR